MLNYNLNYLIFIEFLKNLWWFKEFKNYYGIFSLDIFPISSYNDLLLLLNFITLLLLLLLSLNQFFI
jgi:hypothetical protein